MRTHTHECDRRHRHGHRRQLDDSSPMQQFATTVGDSVERLIRSLEPRPALFDPVPPLSLADLLGRPGTSARAEPLARRSWERGRHRHAHRNRDDCHPSCGYDCDCDCCAPSGDYHYDCDCCAPRCGPDPCHCACCVGDVDLVVYSRVGESRVVPINIANLRKRERDIELELSEFATKGGSPTPVTGTVVGPTKFTLGPCSEHQTVVVVRVGQPGAADPTDPTPATSPGVTAHPTPDFADLSKAELVEAARAATISGASRMTKDELVSELRVIGSVERDRPARDLRDVDDCHVAVADLRVQGCDTRPIRVAVAVLPRDCGPYEVRCDCGCC